MVTIEPGPRLLHRLGDTEPSRPYERFDVRPLSPTIGAEIDGVDLGGMLTGQDIAEIHRALLEWKVIFFRDQRLTPLQQRDFARHWGELEINPFLPQGDVPEVVRFEKDDRTKGVENL